MNALALLVVLAATPIPDFSDFLTNPSHALPGPFQDGKDCIYRPASPLKCADAANLDPLRQALEVTRPVVISTEQRLAALEAAFAAHTSIFPTPPPDCVSFSPTSGPVGTAVTLAGTSLGTTNAASVNGVSAARTSLSDTQVTITVPAGATSGSITIWTSVGTDTCPGTFTVTTEPLHFVAHNGSDANPGTMAQPWKTLAYAVQQMQPGETLYIRGGPAGSDDGTPCSSEGDKNGACWREVVLEGGTIGHSPLTFLGTGYAKAGTAAGGYVTYACYGTEDCIIEPATGYAGAVFGSATSGDPARCSYIRFKNLIVDARNMGDQTPPLDGGSADGYRFTYGSGTGASSTDPTKWCNHVEIVGGKIRHAKNVGGIHAYIADALIDGVEIYENGAHSGEDLNPAGGAADGSDACADGEHDHAIYGLGVRWTIRNNRIHDNIHGIQMWPQTGTATPGSHVIEDNVLRNNHRNPYASARWAAYSSTQQPFRVAANLDLGDQCNLNQGSDGTPPANSYSAYGSVGVFKTAGGGTAGAPTVIRRNEIYGINEWGAAACTSWAQSNYVSVTDNYIYDYNIGGAPGSYTQVRNDGGCTGIVISGNVEGPRP